MNERLTLRPCVELRNCLLVLESRWDQGQGRIGSCGGRTDAPRLWHYKTSLEVLTKEKPYADVFLEGLPFKLGF
jgi:hypothetical protein